MKRFTLVLFVLALILLFVACETEQASWNEFVGEWKYTDGTRVSVLKIDETGEGQLDIDTFIGTTHYFFVIDGIVKGNVLNGTYEYFIIPEGAGDPGGSADGHITSIRLSLHNGKLTVKCEEETPLGGNTFSGGVRQPD